MSIKLKNGINLHRLKNSRFKTNFIKVFINMPLARETATLNGLIPFILKRGSRKYKTAKEISVLLENLYGSRYNIDITKKGERQVIELSLEYPNKKYIPREEEIDKPIIEFVYDVLFNPLVEGNGFKADYVRQEKENLRNLIKSRKNDKLRYSLDRCIELMCKNEKYSIYKYGFINDIDMIKPHNLYNNYINMLKKARIDIFVAGEIDDKMVNFLKDTFGKVETKPNETKVDFGFKYVKNKDVDEYIESMDVKQGKLNIGFRTNVEFGSEDYVPLLVYNSILGDGVYSKLFRNVREKAGLAYYAFSRLIGFKGLLIIGSGIDVVNYGKTLDIIRKQVNSMQKGEITNDELDNSKKNLKSQIKSFKDNLELIIDYYYNNILTGQEMSIENFINRISKTKLEHVVNVAENIVEDTVYFLRNKEAVN